jgi:transcription elongation GreA/GreB family factor
LAEPIQVVPGAWVKVRGPEPGETQVYRLTDAAQVNVEQNEIPASSPFAQAIIGRRPGEVVEYSAPAGVMTVEILDVRIDP